MFQRAGPKGPALLFFAPSRPVAQASACAGLVWLCVAIVRCKTKSGQAEACPTRAAKCGLLGRASARNRRVEEITASSATADPGEGPSKTPANLATAPGAEAPFVRPTFTARLKPCPTTLHHCQAWRGGRVFPQRCYPAPPAFCGEGSPFRAGTVRLRPRASLSTKRCRVPSGTKHRSPPR